MSVPLFVPATAGRARAWPVAMALSLLLPVALGAGRPVLVLNDTNELPYTTPAGDGFLDVVAGEAFRRAGVELRLVRLPAERGLLNADAGIEDGDMVRIAGLDRQYPNLVRVPEKLIDWEFTAFSRDATLPASWPAIRQRRVGHIKGWKIYERAMAGADYVTTTDDPEQLFRLLDLGRIDVALYERWLGAALAKRTNLKGVVPLAPPLATREMFIYLHKRHAALVPKIAAALRALKREGFYQRVQRDKLRPYSQGSMP
jgi:polar amino acid transport system substrate-binding protein